MIALRPMRADEFHAYLDYFIPDYAEEIAASYRLSPEAALAQARQETADDLPAGVDTPGQSLVCIVEGDETIGYFWYRADAARRMVFISDFHILPPHQSKGKGTAALAVLEQALAAEGFEQIRLRVAIDNGKAEHVYRLSGFEPTGINMSKRIGTERPAGTGRKS